MPANTILTGAHSALWPFEVRDRRDYGRGWSVYVILDGDQHHVASGFDKMSEAARYADDERHYFTLAPREWRDGFFRALRRERASAEAR